VFFEDCRDAEPDELQETEHALKNAECVVLLLRARLDLMRERRGPVAFEAPAGRMVGAERGEIEKFDMTTKVVSTIATIQITQCGTMKRTHGEQEREGTGAADADQRLGRRAGDVYDGGDAPMRVREHPRDGAGTVGAVETAGGVARSFAVYRCKHCGTEKTEPFDCTEAELRARLDADLVPRVRVSYCSMHVGTAVVVRTGKTLVGMLEGFKP
jgi:hypothetical protein